MRTSFLLLSVLIFTTYPNLMHNQIVHLARYKPEWIRDGFADAGATHEPWIFQVRRNNANFNHWQKD